MSGGGTDSISLDTETKRLLLAFQRQGDRIKSLLTTIQDMADANDLLALQVMQKLRKMEERIQSLEKDVHELRKLREEVKKGGETE